MDAPSHYGREGESVERRDLEDFVGPCQVVRVSVGRGAMVVPGMLPDSLVAPRLLLATGTYPDPTRFNTDFAALSPDLIPWLHERGVRLVGVDTPSVDPAESPDLPAHRACMRFDIVILEGIVLTSVPEGVFELTALPLRLVGFEASPVRAILRTLG